MAITKYHRLGDLNNRTVFLAVLEAGKSKIVMLADLVFGSTEEGGRGVFLGFLYKVIISLLRSLPS